MDETKDKQLDSNEKLSRPVDENLAMEVPASDKGRETEESTLNEELGRLKEQIAELKGNLIAVNRGIVAKQDTIDQLAKQKQKLLAADESPATYIASALPLPTPIIGKANPQLDLLDNHLEREAIEIFPEEIWELILGSLTEPQDLKSASTSCQLFDKILHPLKQNFLFIGVFPHLCPYLDNVQIVDCRRVCKGWNEGVDNFLENHPALVPCEKAAWNPRNPPPTNGLFYLEFSNGREPGGLNFLEKMRHHSRNPFVGRAVSIRIVPSYVEDVVYASSDSEEEWGPNLARPPIEDLRNQIEHHYKHLYWQALLDFLEMFGKHIWYLKFQCDRRGSFLSEDSLFRFLTRDIFAFAPNLRRIEIAGYLPCPTFLMSMIHSLPVLPKLEALKFEKEFWGNFGAKDMLMGSVIRTLIHASCQQLRELHVHRAAWKHIFKSNLEWTNLTELFICNDGLGEILKLEDLVPSKMPQLRKIGLSPNGLKHEFQEIMKIIMELSSRTNLHVLRLFGEIKREQILHVPDHHLFAHPNLKTLEMDRALFRGDYTLLLCFPFLENLVVFFDKTGLLIRSQDVLDREVVELESYMFEGRVYDCEIWELLPRLKVFTVERDVYTRECYELNKTRNKKILGNEVEHDQKHVRRVLNSWFNTNTQFS